MKVFHGIIEIAGQMGITCLELKKRGHIAIGYNTAHSYLNYKEDVQNTVLWEIQHTSHHIMRFFDLFHFHYGVTMYADYRDLYQIREQGKPIVMHHWGNDVRLRQLASKNNPYVYAEDSPPDERIHQTLHNLSGVIREAIVQDYEVYSYVAPYYERVHVVPIAIDLDRFAPCYPTRECPKPLIIHAPTNPDFKGTYFIENAIERLKLRYNFEYKKIAGVSHQEAARLYREADIVIDQIRCGSHGLFSVEAMALGKPVIAYIRDDVRAKFPADLPIVNANPDTIYEQIQFLLTQPEARVALGKAGRAYAERVHAKEIVTDQVVGIYTRLMQQP